MRLTGEMTASVKVERRLGPAVTVRGSFVDLSARAGGTRAHCRKRLTVYAAIPSWHRRQWQADPLPRRLDGVPQSAGDCDTPSRRRQGLVVTKVGSSTVAGGCPARAPPR